MSSVSHVVKDQAKSSVGEPSAVPLRLPSSPLPAASVAVASIVTVYVVDSGRAPWRVKVTEFPDHCGVAIVVRGRIRGTPW